MKTKEDIVLFRTKISALPEIYLKRICDAGQSTHAVSFLQIIDGDEYTTAPIFIQPYELKDAYKRAKQQIDRMVIHFALEEFKKNGGCLFYGLNDEKPVSMSIPKDKKYNIELFKNVNKKQWYNVTYYKE